MYAVVKFKGQEPVIFGIPNSGYAYSLSTMARVEWVCAATITWGGQINPTTRGKIQDSGLSGIVIKPFLPGDTDPLEPFREPVEGQKP